METSDIRKALSAGRGIPAVCVVIGLCLTAVGVIGLTERVLAHLSVLLGQFPAARDVFPLLLGLAFVAVAVLARRRTRTATQAGAEQ
ncbi:hypothetical protein [Streptomyces olivaceoviridis]|uniref:hypothetical protein n=1 Tax=Streptomyces olivaceoviridis TaxID=1921 RepID=UPI003702886D